MSCISSDFTTERARHIAIAHTGNLIRDLYMKQLELPESQRLKPELIIKTVTVQIIKEFARRAKSFINEFDRISLSKVEEIENYKNQYLELKEIRNKRDIIKNQILELQLNLKNLYEEDKEYSYKRKIYKTKISELYSQFQQYRDEARKMDERVLALVEVIIDKYNKPEYNPDWRQLKNFTVLYNRAILR